MITTATPTQTLTFTRQINAPVEQVYASFINRDDICDWLCYNALLNAAVNGHIFLHWFDTNNDQQHAYGRFTALEENTQVAFTWTDARIRTTYVTATLVDDDHSTGLTLVHSGLADDTPIEVIQHYQTFWEARLDELKSILEHGGRLTITNRVIMGIIPTNFNANAIAEAGVPVDYGAHVGSLVMGYSAEAAGIQAGDVIISVDGRHLKDGVDIHQITQSKVPGDEVEIVWYRGADKHSATVKLSGYPVPPIPADFDEMARQHKARYADFERQLDAVFNGVSERAAAHKPADDQWSACEVLANQILRQRHTLQWLASYAAGPRIITNYTENPTWIAAIVATFPTIADLREEYRRINTEIIQMIHNFSPALLQRKNYLWWMTFEIGHVPDFFKQRMDQATRAIAAAS